MDNLALGNGEADLGYIIVSTLNVYSISIKVIMVGYTHYMQTDTYFMQVILFSNCVTVV